MAVSMASFHGFIFFFLPITAASSSSSSSLARIAAWFPWPCAEGFDLGSSCTQRTLIDATNLVFLLAYCSSLLRRRSGRLQRRQRWDRLLLTACSAAAAVACFVAASLALFSSGGGFEPAPAPVSFYRGAIWIALAASLSFQSSKAVVLLWWVTFSLLVSAFNLGVILQGDEVLQTSESISWAVNLLLLIYSSKLALADLRRSPESNPSEPLLDKNSKTKPRSIGAHGVFHKLAFSWLNPLLRLGKSKPLVLSDIPALEPEDGAFLAQQRFETEFELQRKKSKARSKNLVLLSLLRCHSMEILLDGAYALVKTVSVLAMPLLLSAFVRYSTREEQELSGGLAIVGCLIAAKVAESLSQRHLYFNSRRSGMRMRSAAMAAAFAKSLRISSLGRRRHGAGEIASYIAVDAYRLGEFLWWFHMAWSLPIQLLLSVVILFRTVGAGAALGLIPLAACGFINVPYAKLLQVFQFKLMAAQSERLRATSAILNDMKVIKLQSWEEHFRKVIQSFREEEFKWLSQFQMKRAYGGALYWMSPTLVSAMVFAGAALMGSSELNAETIFTVLAALRVMSDPVRLLPEALATLIQVKVSLDRVEAFLLEDEVKQDVVKGCSSHGDSEAISVEVQEGFYSWDPDSDVLTLKNISLSVARRKKVAICGPIGSGKSSILCALLEEIPKKSGMVRILGSVAYVSQTSWIQSGTIRENVLFGREMDGRRYEEAIRVCALDKDIESFVHGDETEIGQRGLNLSGGQRQRIQLARAVYSDADIYLLDDPFSAVDAHTASILFHDCVMSALADKTVILVTHQVEFLTETDGILVVEDGKITQSGTYRELLESGTAFKQLVDAHRSALAAFDTENQPGDHSVTASDYQMEIGFQPLQAKQNSEPEISDELSVTPPRLTEEEGKEIGDAGLKLYRDYIQVSNGHLLLALVVLALLGFFLLQMSSTYWLAAAIQMPGIGVAAVIGVYSVLSILSCIFAYIRSLLIANLGLKASKLFFSGFMDSVFKAPMSFFDSTPVGRILTRASSDMSILDLDVSYPLAFVVSTTIEITGTIIIMAVVTWQVLIVAIFIVAATVYVQRYYLASARELVRINGTTKAPVVNLVGEATAGAATIRAFGATGRFRQTNLGLVDTDATMFFHTIGAMEWVLIRVEALQNVTLLSSALLLILLPVGTIPPGFVGLSLSYSLSLSGSQLFFTRWYTCLENYIISVERIKQFMHIPPEPPAMVEGRRPPHSWPREGRIGFEDLKIRYHPAAPLVLKGISCAIAAGDKVGVVGRTGSGKTTLIGALFRLVEPASGTIVIDGLDICSIGLMDLRMKLSIIPQEPTLFRGSVRSNMDPLGLHSDNQIWEALDKCQLKEVITSLPSQLDSHVGDDGDNWSLGQRQLFCLGRVLLQKNKILVLDEATASIDSATDATLQRVIREEFSTCTVMTIAHRIPTVTDSDMVMVLSYGKLVEYEKPWKLIENGDSYFSKLVAEYWANHKKASSSPSFA